MSKYHIGIIKTTTIDGIKYRTEIDKYVNINFCAARYTAKIREKAHHDTKIELIPDNMDFLHEITEIFPLSKYNIKIIQNVYGRHKPHISLYLSIRNKKTGANVNLTESALLTDEDYDYIRDILVKEVPKYKWQTADKYIQTDIEGYISDGIIGIINTLITKDAYKYLSRMVAAHYREVKTDGYVDFNTEDVTNIAKEVLENALRSAYELQRGSE